MLIGIPRETRPGETRVAATPETVKKLGAGGKHEVLVETGAGDDFLKGGNLPMVRRDSLPLGVNLRHLGPIVDAVDLDAAGTGVDGIFDQLFYDRSRPLDHLARGDLVRQIVR